MLLRDQSIAKRLLAKFEVLEAVKIEVCGLHVLGAKSTRELAEAKFNIEVRTLVSNGGLVGDGTIVKSYVDGEHVLLGSFLIINGLAAFPCP